MKRKQHELAEIYAQYIDAENERNRQDRYVGKEHHYHASGAGTCSRKLYFQSVELAKVTNPPSAKAYRIMRLGTIVHEDMQNAILSYNINNNNINNNINNNNNDNTISELNKTVEKSKFLIEKEIEIKELNVRGFYDLLQIVGEGDDDKGFFLYDIKTAADYSFKRLFGMGKQERMEHQELQLATYGYAVKEEHGRLDGMYLMYYNKSTSIIKYKEVPLSTLNTAYMFWANINKEHAKGLPPLQEGVSPVMKWECNYCNYLDHCKSIK